jgi:hypothetical protein
MAVAHKPLCNACETPQAKILTLFTRTTYAEGKLKYGAFVLRVTAEAEHVG